MNPLSLIKSKIRKRAISIRDNIDDHTHHLWSKKIGEALLKNPIITNAKTIMLYRPIRKEPNVDLIAHKLVEMGKILVYPRVSKDKLIPHRIHNLDQDFQIGYHNIPEPKESNPIIEIPTIDVVILPGSSFDISGNRIGWGAAHYDGFLSHPEFQGKKIGVGFTFQILKSVPQESHDIRLDALITESRQLTFL
jgi:5-formyltetrahydrofolate cyclo-ligase